MSPRTTTRTNEGFDAAPRREATMPTNSKQGCMIEDLEVPGASRGLETAAAGTCTCTCTCTATAQCD